MAAALVSGSCPLGLAETAGIVMKAQAADHGVPVFQGTEKDYEYWVYEDGSVEIGTYNGRDTELVIPARAKGKQVTGVSLNFTSEKEQVTKVILPEGVKEVGSGCFRGFSKLTSIILPSTLTEIGDYAFLYYKGLTNVVIQEGVTTVGEYVFGSCNNLSSITVPNSLTSIGSAAFGDHKINILGNEKTYAYQ